MDVLFVHWFCCDVNFSWGWDAKRLSRIQFFDQENLIEAFGFVDPETVIHGIHLIPAFATGPTKDLLGDSFVHEEPLAEEWEIGLD